MSAERQQAPAAPVAQRRPLKDIVLYFLRLGTVGFGGPVALVGQMEKELVGDKGWLTKEEMRDAIAVSQSLPGPLAIQVGIFIGYMRGGFWGAWAGGWAFILPNFLIVSALGALYVHFGGLAPAKLTLNSKTVGCSMGRSAGLAPLRILSTKKAARVKKSEYFAPKHTKPPAWQKRFLLYKLGTLALLVISAS